MMIDAYDRINHVMKHFAETVNNHPDMNVRMRWKERYRERDNQPDYWLGVAYGAYQKGAIDKTQMQDVVLALQAHGGLNNDYVKMIIKEITQ